MSSPSRSALEQQLLQQLREAQDRWQIQHFYVGFSGGVDSTALLRGCVAVLPELQPDTQLTALHVNHGLHPQADVWAAHCRRICDELSVVLQTGEVTLPREGNMEANARQARYDYFTQHVGRNSCLLLGHHQDDQVETLLQRLFSGRGWLPMQTSAVLGEGYLLRPLLKCTRTQMQEYVTGQQLAWVEDTSNTDRHLQRNFLRHEVVPLLQQRWPSLAQSLQRVANQSRATEAALQNALIPLGNRVELSLVPEAPDAARAWLRAYLHTRGCYAVTDRALVEFLRQAGLGRASLALPHDAVLHCYQRVLYYEPEAPVPLLPGKLDLGEHLQCAYGVLQLVEADPEAPMAMPYRGPVQVRARAGGERLTSPTAGTVSVKQLMQQACMPPWQRAYLPLLYVNDVLVCVPGLAVAKVDGAVPGDRYCRAVWRANS